MAAERSQVELVGPVTTLAHSTLLTAHLLVIMLLFPAVETFSSRGSLGR